MAKEAKATEKVRNQPRYDRSQSWHSLSAVSGAADYCGALVSIVEFKV